MAHDWCRKNGLLALSLPCETCDGPATLRKRAGYVANESFRCNKNSCHERITREYSFFEPAKLSVNDIMLFVKCYLDGNSLRQCATFAGISYGSTSVEWAVYIRDILKDYFRRYVINETLSGEVELDESLFGRKVKYHRGNPNLGTKIWIFGMVDRNTNSIILYPVNDRSQNTLIPLIEWHIEKGSTIYSDGWSAYCDLNSRGYRHFTVLHKYAFKKIYVNVETKEEIVVHTNRIEGAWKHAKNHFRKMSGTLSSQFEGHLAEIIWRRLAKGRLYESFFEQMKTVYGLDGPPVFAFSRSQPVFDSWDGAPQNSQYKEMVMPVPTDVESEAESSPPMPSMLDSASSTSQRNEDAQFALEISSDDSYIPPNGPQSQLRAETVQSLSELFSGSSISSDSETAEQEKNTCGTTIACCTPQTISKTYRTRRQDGTGYGVIIIGRFKTAHCPQEMYKTEENGTRCCTVSSSRGTHLYRSTAATAKAAKKAKQKGACMPSIRLCGKRRSPCETSIKVEEKDSHKSLLQGSLCVDFFGRRLPIKWQKIF